MASVELGYLGDTFGRPSGEPLPWLAEDAEPNADMWATREQSRGHADIVRELIDGAAGLRADGDNMAPGDQRWWVRYRDELERVMQQADQG